jgi:hypothetical protein
MVWLPMGPRWIDGPKTEDERPRTAHAIKAAPQTAVPTKLAISVR